MSDLTDVRAYWEAQPLFSLETDFEPGTPAFFDHHRRAYLDVLGPAHARIVATAHGRVLDLGCGPGFWTIELAKAGHDVVACDLTQRAVKLTQERLRIAGLRATVLRENAEALSFPDGAFDHVNCQGMIHHTPNPADAVREIARVLKPGGTASLSVYYRNAIVRHWPWLRRMAPRIILGGREEIAKATTAEDFVRRYDGAKNPIGRAYSAAEVRRLVEPVFRIDDLFHFYFPHRAFSFPLPRSLEHLIPFLVAVTAAKP